MSLADIHAAAALVDDVDFMFTYQTPTTHIGNRQLTQEGCFMFALDLALESDRARVPEIAGFLLACADPEKSRFSVCGVDLPRERIAEWSRNENPPVTVAVTPEMNSLDKALRESGSQNVHDVDVLITASSQLTKMREKIPPSTVISARAARREIRAFLVQTASPESALNGMRRVMQTGGAAGPFGERADEENEFGETIAMTMAIVWNYIKTIEDPVLKNRLCESMATKFREIAREQPCMTGVSQRIVDIPTAVDWSLTSNISIEHLRVELAQMAGAVIEAFEEDNEDNCVLVRNEAQQEHVIENPDQTISEIKRRIFLEKADFELVFLRNINADLVRDEAERIFPEGMII